MSAIRSFFGKLPRPSGRHAAIGAGAVSVVGLGAVFLYDQQNVAGGDTAWGKIFGPRVAIKEAPQRVAVEDAIKKEADTKPQQAAEEAAGK